MKRIISLLLAIVFIISAAACSGKGDTGSNGEPQGLTSEELDAYAKEMGIDISGNKEGSAVVERAYTTLHAENCAVLNENPNRGFRGIIEFWHFDQTDEELKEQLDRFVRQMNRYLTVSTYVCYFYLGDYLNSDLDENVYHTMQYVFDYCRENDMQILLRFAYKAYQIHTGPNATTEQTIKHIKQLSENGIIEKNKDVLHCFQAGFVGFFGEWHGDDPVQDRTAILTAFMENVLPEGIYTQVRMPKYKNLIGDDKEYKKYIGYHKDDYFGILDATQIGQTDTYSYGHEDWEQQVKLGAYTPNDVELYYWSQFRDMNVYPDGYASILGASQLRLTTFSGFNGYLDQDPFKDGAMVRWKAQPITEKWLKENGIPYSENYFTMSDGRTVERNAFDYIRDYVGYRLTATKLSVKGGESKGDKVNITLTLKNNGTSSVFNIESKLVILDSKGKVVSEVKAGDPETWHPTDPDNYENRKVLEHKVEATMKLPEKSGEYKLAFRAENKVGATVRLDNNIAYEDGYNILHQFKVK